MTTRTITVWGRATSSNVQTVMWTLAELGLAHERIDLGGAYGGNDAAEYRAMNPNGLIPTMRDGDLVLWESPAILRYLSAKYGEEAFWPSDPGARAALDKWAEWAKTSLAPALIYKVFWQLVRVREAERDMGLVASGAEELKGFMAILDQRLAEGAYLGGEDICFADIMVGHLLYRYMTLDFPKIATPQVDAYYARLTARPAYAEHVMVSYDTLRPQ
jgi:glutathione S-transferase